MTDRWNLGAVEMTIYCKCGDRMRFNAPSRMVEPVIRAFAAVHKGEGHGPVTREQWRKVKRS